MRLRYPLVLFAASSVALGACLFPSFEGFESAGSGASTASSTASTGASTGSGGGGAGGAGAGAGDTDAGACAPVDDALVVWPFDDGTGLIARDCTGKYPGTILGETAWTPGRDGGFALTFEVPDASDDGGDGGQVEPPMGSKVDEVGGIDGARKPFTAATWYESTLVNKYSYWRYLVTRLGTGFDDAWGLGMMGAGTDAGQPQVQLVLIFANAAHKWDKKYSEPFVNVGWNHVAVTYDGNTRFAFYVNGELNSKGTIAAGAYEPLSGGLHAGAATGANNVFEGALSGMRMYTRELSANEISQLAKF